MKTGTRRHGAASAQLGFTMVVSAHLRGRIREITALHTPEADRGKGDGTRLMRSICAEADKEALTLMLMPETDRLAAWYAGFGFVTIQKSPALMVRAVRQ